MKMNQMKELLEEDQEENEKENTQMFIKINAPEEIHHE